MRLTLTIAFTIAGRPGARTVRFWIISLFSFFLVCVVAASILRRSTVGGCVGIANWSLINVVITYSYDILTCVGRCVDHLFALGTSQEPADLRFVPTPCLRHEPKRMRKLAALDLDSLAANVCRTAFPLSALDHPDPSITTRERLSTEDGTVLPVAMHQVEAAHDSAPDPDLAIRSSNGCQSPV